MVGIVGIGSGLNASDMISQIMMAERVTYSRMQQQEQSYQSKISAYGELKNSISNFQKSMEDLSSMDKFSVYKTTVNEEDDVEVSTNAQASPGSYTLEVSQLATSHKVSSNTSFADSTASTGATGTIDITVGDESFEVEINSPNDSLVDIRNAINNANDNIGVKASIMNVDDGEGNTVSRLVLTSTETGAENQISVSDVSGNVASTLDITNTMQEAKDAVFTLDGFAITRPSNNVTDAIDGLTLELKEANNKPVIINVTRDTDAVIDNVQKFVDSYNEVFKTIDKLSYYDLNTKDANRKNNGDLWDETGLTQLSISFRRTLSEPASGAGRIQFLSEVGITARTNKDDPALKLNKDTLEDAIKNDFDEVARLFADDPTGVAVRFNALAEETLGDDGLITLRTDSLNSSVRDLGDRMEREEDRLQEVEARYYDEFMRLDSAMTKFNSLQNYLVQTLATLN